MNTTLILPEYILLVGAILMLAGIFLGKVGSRFGVPALLLFLATGILFGSDGLGLQFNNTRVTQFVGVVALSVILFFGGMETKISEVRSVLRPGLLLSTVGVLLTTLFFGGFLYWMGQYDFSPIHLSFPIALLLAATMSSTDSASVFALLKARNLHLKERLKPILELESGSNDPMAYMLTIALIQVVTGSYSGGVWGIVLTFLLQFSVGSLVGYLMGRFSVWLLNKAGVDNVSLYSISLLCLVFLAFSISALLGGNGYLTVYLMGVVVGNRKLASKKSVFTFFDGITWMVQIWLFILLGLLVNPREVLPIMPFALLAGLFMIFVARPLAVHLSLIGERGLSLKGKNFLCWVGLRGAVPIIFATYPLMSEVPGAETLFNIVFFITLLSLLIQGSSITWVARRLGLDEEPEAGASLFGVKIPEATGAKLEERKVSREMLSRGHRLMELDLEDSELVILVRRGDRYIVPKGKLELKEDDTLLIVSESSS